MLRLLVHLAAALGAMGWLGVVQPSPGAAQAAAKIASSNPLSGVPEAIAAGERLYAKFCLQCHGAKGDGVSPRWGRMGADLRNFWRGYTEFVNIVAAGRPEKRMPPWGSVLDADQINQIGAYLEMLALPGAKWTD
jgi:mono/diheme cytochrome c family protein